MDEELSKYKHLIHRMEATSKAPVPDLFTERVMGRIMELDEGIWAKVKRAVYIPAAADAYARWAQRYAITTPRECSFCFFISGFFYLIMGIMLMMGFRALGSGMAATDWIALQPHVTFGAAIWLMALGALLIMDGRIAVKIAQYGTLLYIFFTVVNGVLMRPYLHIPYAGIMLTGFVGTGVIMGIMLVLAVKKMELRQV
jgi:hypothetical protein